MGQRGDVEKIVQQARQPLWTADFLLTHPYNPDRDLTADEKRQLRASLSAAIVRCKDAMKAMKARHGRAGRTF